MTRLELEMLATILGRIFARRFVGPAANDGIPDRRARAGARAGQAFSVSSSRLLPASPPNTGRRIFGQSSPDTNAISIIAFISKDNYLGKEQRE